MGVLEQISGMRNCFRSVQNLLNDPSLMQHIQQMSETLHRTEQLKSELSAQEERQRVLEQQHNEFNQQIHKQPPLPPMMQGAINQDYRATNQEDSQEGHDGSKSDSYYGRLGRVHSYSPTSDKTLSAVIWDI